MEKSGKRREGLEESKKCSRHYLFRAIIITENCWHLSLVSATPIGNLEGKRLIGWKNNYVLINIKKI